MVKMLPKKQLTKQILIENLIDYLPDAQQAFKATKPYLDLCDAVWDVLKAGPDDRPMFQQALKHQRDVFEDFCDFENEQEAKRIEERIQAQEAMQAKIDALRIKEPNMADTGWHSFLK